MSAEPTERRPGVVMHVRCPDRLPEETYRQVLEQLHELSAVVRALPPTAAPVDLRGALRYHRATAVHLGEILRLRTVSRYGVDVRVGIGPTVTVAATASAQVEGAGGVLAIEAADAADWLALLPVQDLHGIGPRQAAVLRRYGVDRVGLLAVLPAATVQRLLGKAGRIAAEWARGTDPRTVTPRRVPAACPPPSASGTASPTMSSTALRRGRPCSHQSCSSAPNCAAASRPRALTLTLTFAGGAAWEKARRLAALRAEDLVDGNQVAEQLSLDAARRARLTAEETADRIREKFGPGAIGPAATYRPAS